MIQKLEQLNEPLWTNEVLWKCNDSEISNNKFGVCDSNDTLVLPIIYDEISLAENNQIKASLDNKNEYFEISSTNLIKLTTIEL